MSKRIETATTQRLRRYRWAVIALARQRAIKAIKRQFKAQGVRLSEVSNRDIHILADAYLEVHRAQLVAEAEKIIATWPGFARWRCPGPVSVKLLETEHSQIAGSTTKGQITND